MHWDYQENADLRGDLRDGSLGPEDSQAHAIVLKSQVWKRRGKTIEGWGKAGMGSP